MDVHDVLMELRAAVREMRERLGFLEGHTGANEARAALEAAAKQEAMNQAAAAVEAAKRAALDAEGWAVRAEQEATDHVAKGAAGLRAHAELQAKQHLAATAASAWQRAKDDVAAAEQTAANVAARL